LPTKLPWVDYGCGDGKLADMLSENKQLRIKKYDKYTKHNDLLSYDDLIRTKYSVVINCSVFEHVLSLESLEEITNLVADDGVLALHTLACEEIPKDPGWFYLLPVHCAFYTNRSMDILFANLGFNASVYHVDSRMWFWFRKNGDRVRQILHRQKKKMKGEYHFKFGFVDYWK
jgi:2-polyprenyl-3-methyl-5-hydroxy-6-metoxy-1,4-benzoquinol methylase